MRDAEHLEQVIERVTELGDIIIITTTSVVLCEPVHPRAIDIAAWIPKDS